MQGSTFPAQTFLLLIKYTIDNKLNKIMPKRHNLNVNIKLVVYCYNFIFPENWKLVIEIQFFFLW